MRLGFLIQFAVSLLAVAALVGLAAWARIARPAPPLDEAHARAVFAQEFPGDALDAVWTASDGETALARAGAALLILRRAGDGYVARRGALSQLAGATLKDGAAILHAGDATGPPIRVTPGAAPWPPFGPPLGDHA